MSDACSLWVELILSLLIFFFGQGILSVRPQWRCWNGRGSGGLCWDCSSASRRDGMELRRKNPGSGLQLNISACPYIDGKIRVRYGGIKIAWTFVSNFFPLAGKYCINVLLRALSTICAWTSSMWFDREANLSCKTYKTVTLSNWWWRIWLTDVVHSLKA